MNNGIILLADNLKVFVDTRSQLLERAGYQVLRAYSAEQAASILREEWVHLAILDLRLEDDNAETDQSGLELANSDEFSSIPVIILTGFPSWEVVRQAFGHVSGNVVGFLSKKEDADIMIDAVKKGLEKNLRIDRKVFLSWSNPLSLSLPHLIALLDDELEPLHIPNRLQEAEDLLRMVFRDSSQVSFQRLLWHRMRRLAAEVSVHTSGQESQYILTLGSRSAVLQEQAAYKEFIEPRLTNQGGIMQVQTTRHYGAILWNASQSGGGSILLSDFIHRNPERKITQVFNWLFNEHLQPWLGASRILDEQQDILTYYSARLRTKNQGDLRNVEESILRLLRQAIEAGLLDQVDKADGQLRLCFPNGHKVTVASPSAWLHKMGSMPVGFLKVTLPGDISLRNVLVHEVDSVQLTDFKTVEEVPLLDIYVRFENETRFTLVDGSDLLARLEMERSLALRSSLHDSQPAPEVEPGCKTAVQTILTIRRFAAQRSAEGELDYWVGLFFNSLEDLPDMRGMTKPDRWQIVQAMHRLLLCASLCEKIDALLQDAAARIDEEDKSLQIDEINHEVHIHGRPILLTPTEYQLLLYLYKHQNQLCKREEIVLAVFGYQDADEVTQKSLLNTQIGRLRSKIEATPSMPRHVVTVRGLGYKLVLAS